MTRPEHFISDAKAYRKQMADRMATLLEWARAAAEGDPDGLPEVPGWDELDIEELAETVHAARYEKQRRSMQND